MYCKYCGAKLYDNHKYCTNCGIQFKFETNINLNKNSTEKAYTKIGLIINFVLVVILVTVYFANNKNKYYVSPIESELNIEQNISEKTTIDASKYINEFISSEDEYKNKIKDISYA